MRWSIIILAALPALAVAVTPADHAALAQAYAAQTLDGKHLVFVSWIGTAKDDLTDRQKVLLWWLHQLSFAEARSRPGAVPKSDGLLWAIDLRDYAWNAEAWQAVAQRDPYFGDGLVVRADWLFRDSIETDRSPSYYDLLFAQFRYKTVVLERKVAADRWKTVKKTIRHRGGDYVYPDDTGRVVRNVEPGAYVVELKFRKEVGKSIKEKKQAFVDFPRNVEDWDRAFGTDLRRAFAKQRNLQLATGAVVAGYRDDREKGSIVTYNNRLLRFEQSMVGAAFRSFDTTSTAKIDYLQISPELTGDINDVPAEAGELLNDLPNGGQAALLIDGKGKRIERADTQVARNSVDPHYADVRTPMGCVQCHGAQDGFIPPDNLVPQMLKAGVDAKIKGRDTRNRYQSFFLAGTGRIVAERKPYAALRQWATGWDADELAKQFNSWRDGYDAPVTLAVAAAEHGVDEAKIKAVLVKSPKARLALLGQGRAMPRSLWEVTYYRQTEKLLEKAKP